MNNDLLMIVTEKSLLFYSPRFSRKNLEANTKFANELINNHKLNNKSKYLSIYRPEQSESKKMTICPLLLRIDFGDFSLVQANLHSRQNYIVVVNRNKEQHNLINVVNLQKGTLQTIRVKTKSIIQEAKFHPRLPQIVIMTKSCLFVYDLKKQSIEKKLISQSKQLSCFEIH